MVFIIYPHLPVCTHGLQAQITFITSTSKKKSAKNICNILVISTCLLKKKVTNNKNNGRIGAVTIWYHL